MKQHTVRLICKHCGDTFEQPNDLYDPTTYTWPLNCPICRLSFGDPTPHRLNSYQYESRITRIRDVYGKFAWVATRHLEMSNKTMLHICNGRGLLRAYTKAGDDRQNSLHRDNVAEVLQERMIEV